MSEIEIKALLPLAEIERLGLGYILASKKLPLLASEIPTIMVGGKQVFCLPEEFFDINDAVTIKATINVKKLGGEFNPLGGPAAYIATKEDLGKPAWVFYYYQEEDSYHFFCVP